MLVDPVELPTFPQVMDRQRFDSILEAQTTFLPSFSGFPARLEAWEGWEVVVEAWEGQGSQVGFLVMMGLHLLEKEEEEEEGLCTKVLLGKLLQ